ncbi:MAG: gamma-glutamyl-gamma-aminobutyrate hydrolase family protein, partial [Sphingomicrobium sp.]
HQAIALACGARIERTPPVHGKIGPVRHDSTGLFEGLASPFEATRYHSLGAVGVEPPLFANAWSDDGCVMGLRHESAPVHGVQFHPESIGTEVGNAILAAFLRNIAKRA